MVVEEPAAGKIVDDLLIGVLYELSRAEGELVGEPPREIDRLDER